jgi:flavin-dependent dehydrogenase
MSEAPSPRLTDHSRVAVIGGGPAGSFFALTVQSHAALLGLRLDLTIFERKDLSAAGPRGCNMCAGILSRRAIDGLAELGMVLPLGVVRAQIDAYQLHWGDRSITIHPPDPTRTALSVYRAGGPRKSPHAPTAGFDDWLLGQAAARGARIIPERVDQVVFDPLPRVRTAAREETFDLVVLACGVNATPPVFWPLQYAHPPTETMAQDELFIGPGAGEPRMGSTVHVYFEQPRGLIFGALIPKGNFANVSLLGQRFGRDSIDQFLAVQQVTDIVGVQPPRLCGCRPRVAVAPARGYYADRFVAVGDACVTRLYKDGIGSAVVTASAAVDTALHHGVSRTAFARHYAPVCRAIAHDNQYGRAVFSLIERSKHNARFMRALGHALGAEAGQRPELRVLSQTLWALFTGDANYEEIFWMMVKPNNVARIAKAMLQELSH